jgi:putative methyltransferase (TIGR04325 family)
VPKALAVGEPDRLACGGSANCVETRVFSTLMHSSLRTLVPRSWRRGVRRWLRGPLYEGNYASWGEAQRASRGYADPAIFEKALAAARSVRDGRAAWERDTVLFDQPACNEPLLHALQIAADQSQGRLDLVDFGGALGSTWWQHRPWLSNLREIRWAVVEQPHVVAAGRSEFTVGPLSFFSSLKECAAAGRCETVLFSSVLPYVEAPHAILAEARELGFRHVIVDRTGFVSGRDRLTVQHVPRSIYAASYPCWFFDRAALLKSFAPDWKPVAEWTTDDDVDIDASHGGFMLVRTSPA